VKSAINAPSLRVAPRAPNDLGFISRPLFVCSLLFGHTSGQTTMEPYKGLLVPQTNARPR
jgi:hypothetical protein